MNSSTVENYDTYFFLYQVNRIKYHNENKRSSYHNFVFIPLMYNVDLNCYNGLLLVRKNIILINF